MTEGLPEYVHNRLYDLALTMKDARETGTDDAVHDAFEEMRDYCLALIAEGREFTTLWETLGDFALDDEQALEYYDHALMLAERNEESIHTILLGIGERRASLQQYDDAREILRKGLHLAIEAADEDMVTRADVLLSELPI